MASNIPVIVQGNSFSLAIPLQIYYINGDQMDLQDYTPDPTDDVTVQLKGSRRNYTYTPTIDGNVANIDLTGNELADNYSVVVSIVKDNGQRLRSFRTDQFFIVESSDDLTTDDIVAGLEENVIYLNAQAFIAGADGRGIEGIQKTGTSGLVDTYTIYYTDNTTSTFQVTNGANGQAGAQGADGVGITSIEKTGTSGLVDTYTITLSNGATSTFEVTNGQDGHDLGLAVIVDDLTTGGHEDALSAEMGKELNNSINGYSVEPILVQGTISDTDGSDGSSTSTKGRKRVRTQDFFLVNGKYKITVIPTSSLFKLFYYDEEKAYTGSSNWIEGGTYEGEGAYYVRFCIMNSTDTYCSPSDFDATIEAEGLSDKVEELQGDVNAMTGKKYPQTYTGEKIAISENKFKSEIFKVLPMSGGQGMAVYGDYVVIFDYSTSASSAYVIQLSSATLLATITLPNGSYTRPHCNCVSIGDTFNSVDSFMPLVYVSQWESGSQQGCLVYDFTLSNGVYSANLVQTILPTNVSTDTRGAGQTDWCVDPLGGYIYSIAYLLYNGAHTIENNKTMVVKFKLPSVGDGSDIIFSDANVLDHFELPIIIYRQDMCFVNGRILLVAGSTNSVPRKLVAIDTVGHRIASVAPLTYINKEPEGIGVTEGKLLVRFTGDANLYQFFFA